MASVLALHGCLTVLLESWGLLTLRQAGRRLCHLLVHGVQSFFVMLDLRLNVSLPRVLRQLYVGLTVQLVLLLNGHRLAVKCWCGGALTWQLDRGLDVL